MKLRKAKHRGWQYAVASTVGMHGVLWSYSLWIKR